MIWGTMSPANGGTLCFIKSKVNAPVSQEILEHVMLPSADEKLNGDDHFVLHQDFYRKLKLRLNGLPNIILLCLTGHPTHLI